MASRKSKHLSDRRKASATHVPDEEFFNSGLLKLLLLLLLIFILWLGCHACVRACMFVKVHMNIHRNIFSFWVILVWTDWLINFALCLPLHIYWRN